METAKRRDARLRFTDLIVANRARPQLVQSIDPDVIVDREILRIITPFATDREHLREILGDFTIEISGSPFEAPASRRYYARLDSKADKGELGSTGPMMTRDHNKQGIARMRTGRLVWETFLVYILLLAAYGLAVTGVQAQAGTLLRLLISLTGALIIGGPLSWFAYRKLERKN